MTVAVSVSTAEELEAKTADVFTVLREWANDWSSRTPSTRKPTIYNDGSVSYNFSNAHWECTRRFSVGNCSFAIETSPNRIWWPVTEQMILKCRKLQVWQMDCDSEFQNAPFLTAERLHELLMTAFADQMLSGNPWRRHPKGITFVNNLTLVTEQEGSLVRFKGLEAMGVGTDTVYQGEFRGKFLGYDSLLGKQGNKN